MLRVLVFASCSHFANRFQLKVALFAEHFRIVRSLFMSTIVSEQLLTSLKPFDFKLFQVNVVTMIKFIVSQLSVRNIISKIPIKFKLAPFLYRHR